MASKIVIHSIAKSKLPPSICYCLLQATLMLKKDIYGFISDNLRKGLYDLNEGIESLNNKKRK